MSDAARSAVAEDPFWSVVRRRHPDLDIVILPQEPPRPRESGQPPRAAEPFEQMQLADADELWAALVGHGMPQRDAQWVPGPTADAVRHAVTLTNDGVSDTVGLAHLREAIDLLTAGGWHVFTPPTGMPRLNADRPGELGAEELLFGYAPDSGRLFARLTSTGLPVDAATRRRLMGAAE